jgi:hypothetical protein
VLSPLRSSAIIPGRMNAPAFRHRIARQWAAHRASHHWNQVTRPTPPQAGVSGSKPRAAVTSRRDSVFSINFHDLSA